jgi:hypothetical protein
MVSQRAVFHWSFKELWNKYLNVGPAMQFVEGLLCLPTYSFYLQVHRYTYKIAKKRHECLLSADRVCF